MLNLAVAIALAARAKAFPAEWAHLVEIQNLIFMEARARIILSQAGLRGNTWEEAMAHLTTCFALKKVKKGCLHPAFGYCRLPSSHRQAWPGARRRAGASRFEPDLDRLFVWP